MHVTRVGPLLFPSQPNYFQSHRQRRFAYLSRPLCFYNCFVDCFSVVKSVYGILQHQTVTHKILRINCWKHTKKYIYGCKPLGIKDLWFFYRVETTQDQIWFLVMLNTIGFNFDVRIISQIEKRLFLKLYTINVDIIVRAISQCCLNCILHILLYLPVSVQFPMLRQANALIGKWFWRGQRLHIDILNELAHIIL